MFIPLPIRFRDGHPHDAIPVANALIVATNVIAFCAGRQPWVGAGASWHGVISYAFGHASAWHLVANMLLLLVFGNPLNRRLGNGWYLAGYLGCALVLGIVARFLCSGPLFGSSGAIFSVMAAAAILQPSAEVTICYIALFPATLVTGLFKPPKHWVFWLIRWDSFSMKAAWTLLLVPVLELWILFWTGWNWVNLAHLAGFILGVLFVAMLPDAIVMSRRRWSAA